MNLTCVYALLAYASIKQKDFSNVYVSDCESYLCVRLACLCQHKAERLWVGSSLFLTSKPHKMSTTASILIVDRLAEKTFHCHHYSQNYLQLWLNLILHVILIILFYAVIVWERFEQTCLENLENCCSLLHCMVRMVHLMGVHTALRAYMWFIEWSGTKKRDTCYAVLCVPQRQFWESLNGVLNTKKYISSEFVFVFFQDWTHHRYSHPFLCSGPVIWFD